MFCIYLSHYLLFIIFYGLTPINNDIWMKYLKIDKLYKWNFLLWNFTMEISNFDVIFWEISSLYFLYTHTHTHIRVRACVRACAQMRSYSPCFALFKYWTISLPPLAIPPVSTPLSGDLINNVIYSWICFCSYAPQHDTLETPTECINAFSRRFPSSPIGSRIERFQLANHVSSVKSWNPNKFRSLISLFSLLWDTFDAN